MVPYDAGDLFEQNFSIVVESCDSKLQIVT